MISNDIKAKENLHIVFWLLKDMCWALEFKIGGIVMVVPTVLLAIIIAYKTKDNTSDFVHNLAVCFWICANASWMLGEFFKYELRVVASIFFGLGLCIILSYYLYNFLVKRAN
jgi:F0F1-type ATP synthase assembly protein I